MLTFALSKGTIRVLIPSFLSPAVIGSTPVTLRSEPSRESSPIKAVSLNSVFSITPVLERIPIAIGKS